MEKKLREEKIHASIFCSPHNPSGRVGKLGVGKTYGTLRKGCAGHFQTKSGRISLCRDFSHIPTQSVNDYAKMHTIAPVCAVQDL